MTCDSHATHTCRVQKVQVRRIISSLFCPVSLLPSGFPKSDIVLIMQIRSIHSRVQMQTELLSWNSYHEVKVLEGVLNSWHVFHPAK